MYRREVLAGLPVASRSFDVLQEILIRVDAEGWRIREIPFRYMARGSARSHVRLLRFGWAYLRTLARMWRFRHSIDAADYDARAYDTRIWPQRYWQRARHRIVLDFARGCEHVLDIRCGSGRIALDLPNAVGLDVRPNKLRWLSWREIELQTDSPPAAAPGPRTAGLRRGPGRRDPGGGIDPSGSPLDLLRGVGAR